MRKTRLFSGILGFILVLTGTAAKAQDSHNVELLYHWSDPELPASFFHNNTYNEIWGYAADGREYAIIGSTMGTHIFDITDIDQAAEIHFIPGAVQGGIIVHRDYHDYNGYLYAVCDEGNSSLQIIDLHNLPESAEVLYDSNALFSRSHNIFIDAANARMYVCGGNYQFDVYSLEDPLSPALLKRCQNQVPGWSTQVGYVHDVYVENNIAWCNAEDALWVVDFSDIANPQFLGDLSTYPESGYNHSGWLRSDGQIYAMADETHGTHLKLIDASDPADMDVLSLFGTDIHPQSIAHNLLFKDNFLHVSYYHDGYHVWDTTDPADPQHVAWYDTSVEPHTTNYRGAWGVYPFLPSGKVLLSDMQEGLFVFQADLASGVTENAAKELTVFPNPAEIGSSIYVQTDRLNLRNGQAELFGLDGTLLASTALQAEGPIARVELPADIPSGLYVLRIFADGKTLSQRVVLE